MALAVLVLLGGLPAQTGCFTVPAKGCCSEPDKVWNDSRPVGLFAFMYDSVLRTQVLYATSDIPLATAQLKDLSIRHSHQESTPGGTGFAVRIDLSLGGRLPTQALAVFDGNHGSPRTTVFQGILNLPNRATSPWPQPWENPIPFATPFAFRQGPASLVLDVIVSGGTFIPFMAEAYGKELGWYQDAYEQKDCRTYQGIMSGGLNAYRSELCPGGMIDFYLSFGGQNASLANNLMLFSAFGPGSTFVGLKLPFLIASLGIPAAPNCFWAVGLEGPSLVLAYRHNGTGSELVPPSPIPIPSDPALAGAVLYSQVVTLDQWFIQPVRLFSTRATRWQLGPGTTVPAATIRGAGQPKAGPPTSGSVYLSQGISSRFGY